MKKIDLSFKIGGFTIEFLLTKKMSKKVLDFATSNRAVVFEDDVIALCKKLQPIKSDSLWTKYSLIDNFDRLIEMNSYRKENPAIQVPLSSNQISPFTSIETARYYNCGKIPCVFNSKMKMGY